MGGITSKRKSLGYSHYGSSSNSWGHQRYSSPHEDYAQHHHQHYPPHPPPPPPQSYGSYDPPQSRKKLERKFSKIEDDYTSLEQVTEALARAGLESSNLIVGIDFTKSNEWTGARSFNRRSLHHIGDGQNPYEQAISIIGKTLSSFDEDNLIPCFGFGDASTHDQEVFSFYPDERFCNGFEEVLTRYRELVPQLRLAGPTSFAPIIEMAITIVEQSGGQYHVLVIIADGQVCGLLLLWNEGSSSATWNCISEILVLCASCCHKAREFITGDFHYFMSQVTRSVDTSRGQLSPQEKSTVEAIVKASEYPLSIILVGVGDGPWDMMKEFDDNIPARAFDNFQFVNFTDIMSKNIGRSRKEAEFALAALMEIPSQYRATLELNILGARGGKGIDRVSLPPPQYNAISANTKSSQSSSSFQPSAPSSRHNPVIETTHSSSASDNNVIASSNLVQFNLQICLPP
ncbi:hypothetical protein SAY87_021809 [Trapa incisa]|uniref:VWFA domain-containing protein n=1 Tax=Trapa incisa TaxID=236973 RepID=A0AAN7JSN9_9MYRT|nr:hypothetical protein SAY87_021809 [Trapa incisa]